MRMRLKRYVSAVLILYISSTIFAGCEKTGSREQPDTEHFTEIVVGSDDYPPFSYVDENGDYVGIDVELAEEAFKRLGHNSNKDKTVIQSGRS